MERGRRSGTSISPLEGDFREEVRKVLKEHPEYYAGYDDVVVLHAQFYQVLTEARKLVGFFALFYWQNEVVLGCVYVYPCFRKRGVFMDIVTYAKKKTPASCYLTINAERDNKIANLIYTTHFQFHSIDQEDGCHWYIIKEPK